MYKDKDNIPLQVGDTFLVDGCLYIAKHFIVYEIVTEVVGEDKLTHNFKSFQLKDVLKIS
jgi:hypothetical protein